MASEASPVPAYVTLVSSDDFQFHIRRSAAVRSGTIRRMLDRDNAFAEAITGVCRFENINGIVLEKVVEYLYYNEKNREQTGVADMDIPSELCLELLMAADYLDC